MPTPTGCNDAVLEAALRRLRSPETIRERCGRILAAGRDDALEHFVVRDEAMPAIVQRVVEVTRRNYPDSNIPVHGRWNHFRAGGVDRVAELDASMGEAAPIERARAHVDAVVLSVLLDAGAGARWRYVEPQTGRTFARSEGLAVATARAVQAGAWSADASRPVRVDASVLRQTDEDTIARVFDVRSDNPLVGLSGRAALMRNLGRVLAQREEFGGLDRPGGWVDHLLATAQGSSVPAKRVLGMVLTSLQDIWPGRLELGGVNLGDVWAHPRAGGDGLDAGLVPLHKLSTWLTYSLVEPLQLAGLRVRDLDVLTGLAEYRNGGLLVDLGALVLRDPQASGRLHRPEDPLVVEWRALTVALLDEVARGVRGALGLSADALPLARVLEGGTWAAGREVAREARPDASPPIIIDSDGTVF